MGMHPKSNHQLFSNSFGYLFNIDHVNPSNDIQKNKTDLNIGLSLLADLKIGTSEWHNFLDYIALQSDFSSNHGTHLSPKSALDIVNNFIAISSYFGDDFIKFENRKSKSFLDFGAGVYRPLCVSAILYCNGFDPVFAFEPYSIKSPFAWQSFWTLIREMLCEPNKFIIGDTPKQFFLSRIKELLSFETKLNLDQFSDRKINKLSFSGITLVSDLSLISNHTVDIHFSNAVLEHINEFSTVMYNLTNLIKLGGKGYHIVDFADHRHYDDNSISPVQKYFDGVLDEINGLPPSSLERELTLAGFNINKFTAQKIPNTYISNNLPMIDFYKKFNNSELLEHINFYKLVIA